jgi:hypothetical protein
VLKETPMPPEPCPNCARNAPVLKESQDKAARLTKDNELLMAELAMVKDPLDFHSLSDLVAHCEGGECQGHAEEWQRLKEGIVGKAYENIPNALLSAKAKERGLIPDRLVIRSGA